mmetsp:Transcript_38103/g.75575  ORF Transcript_38103/g.75575 Transcript_38103/m.75575 type:complete len:177 (-) Transcript_38103:45-575(-)
MAPRPPVLCVAFVGTDGSPLFFRSFVRDEPPPGATAAGAAVTTPLCESNDLELSLLLFASLDQVEMQLRASAQAAQRGDTKNSDPYLGILTPALFNVEDCNIYGYVSATNVKILAVVREDAVKQRRDEDSVLRSMMKALNFLYADAVSNPFYDGLDRPSFAAAVDSAIDRYAVHFA